MTFFKANIKEVIILIIGLLISATSIFVINLSTSLLIFAITLSIDIVCITIKSAINESTDKFRDYIVKDEVYNLYINHLKINSKWKNEAENSIRVLSNRIKQMVNGNMIIFGVDILNYQEKVIRNTKKELYAIHIGLDEKSLCHWDITRKSTEFYKLIVEANKKLDKNVIKKRIFVIDKDYIKDSGLDDMFQSIIKAQREELNFDVRILYKSDIEKYGRRFPEDIIISDREEVIIFSLSGTEWKISANIDPMIIKEKIEEFDILWSVGN